jgi:hypothetical protein
LAGRPSVAPPGIPADRAAALRDAFDAMSKNRRFLDEARRLHMDVQPGTGSEIETLVKEICALPKAVIAITKQALTNGDAGRRRRSPRAAATAMRSSPSPERFSLSERAAASPGFRGTATEIVRIGSDIAHVKA